MGEIVDCAHEYLLAERGHLPMGLILQLISKVYYYESKNYYQHKTSESARGEQG